MAMAHDGRQVKPGETVGIGHNSGERPQWVEDRNRAFVDSIAQYTGDARIEEALLREQLGDLEGMTRVLLIRNGTLLNTARYCRLNPKADCTIAVLELISWLSDNSRGYCSISQRRMSEILSRRRETILVAIKRLVESGCIGHHVSGGNQDVYWPRIPAPLAEAPAGVMWFVNTFSRPAGNPRAVRLGDVDQPVRFTAPVSSTTRVVEHTGEPVRSSRRTRAVPPDGISLIEITDGEGNAHAREDEIQHGHGVVQRGDVISHPGFPTFSLKAVEMDAATIGIPAAKARSIAIASALDWAVGVPGEVKRPRSVILKALNMYKQQQAVNGVQLDQVRAAPSSAQRSVPQPRSSGRVSTWQAMKDAVAREKEQLR